MEMCETCLSSQQSTQRSFGEAQIKQLLREMGAALSHMHTRGLVHLDIKPENVFFNQGVYKLGDFGHATLLEAKQVRRSLCSPLDSFLCNARRWWMGRS